MNKTRCIIVDDEPLAIKVIKNYLSNFDTIEIVAECKNAIQAFEILKQENIDLIFLDIQMPKITGIEFLRSINNPPKVIITTAYRNYAMEGYELDVIDYLLKPIPLDRFMKAMDKFYRTQEVPKIEINKEAASEEELFIYLSQGKDTHKIFLKDIVYIESFREYITLHTMDKEISAKHKISDFENKLPADNFIRIHKSYIVSLHKINSFNNHSIQVKSAELPIGRTYKESVFKALKIDGAS